MFLFEWIYYGLCYATRTYRASHERFDIAIKPNADISGAAIEKHVAYKKKQTDRKESKDECGLLLASQHDPIVTRK